MMAIGLNLQIGIDLNEGNSLKVEPVISGEELSDALDRAMEISSWTDDEIKTAGWKTGKHYIALIIVINCIIT